MYHNSLPLFATAVKTQRSAKEPKVVTFGLLISTTSAVAACELVARKYQWSFPTIVDYATLSYVSENVLEKATGPM